MCYSWEVPNPKGVIVFSHGHGVHATFELLNSVKAPGVRTQYRGTWVEAFNKAGYSVFAMDHQGAADRTTRGESAATSRGSKTSSTTSLSLSGWCDRKWEPNFPPSCSA